MKVLKIVLIAILIYSFTFPMLISCGMTVAPEVEKITNTAIDGIETKISEIKESITENIPTTSTMSVAEEYIEEMEHPVFVSNEIPQYSGQDSVVVNGDEPFFSEEERNFNGTFIELSSLDGLGRCGVAKACVGKETEPTEERGDISHVYPSGWKQLQLKNGEWLYNRSHLLMFALTGLNDDERNLITGTEYFNKELMLPYETQIKWAVDNYNAHVLYRVTPVYDGDNLVAKGVLLEAYCIEYPEECTFCTFIYNIEPGVDIDYSTGEAKET